MCGAVDIRSQFSKYFSTGNAHKAMIIMGATWKERATVLINPDWKARKHCSILVESSLVTACETAGIFRRLERNHPTRPNLSGWVAEKMREALKAKNL